MYIPSDIVIENCLNGKSCPFGICDECIVTQGKETEVTKEKESFKDEREIV